MEKKLAIGVDIGGTYIKAGLVDSDGNIEFNLQDDSNADISPNAVIETTEKLIREILSQHPSQILGIGIGCPGIVNSETGDVMYPPNFANWKIVNLEKEFSTKLSVPIRIENDTKCATLAELKFGSGKNKKNFIFVTWGTGIGGGIVVDGKIFKGTNGAAGEIGHISIDHNGNLCKCGNRGCLETYVGRKHISQKIRTRLEKLPTDILSSQKMYELSDGKLENIQLSTAAAAAYKRDLIAHEVLMEASQFLGIALGSVVNILDIQTIILGGGIALSGDFIFDAIELSIRSTALKPLGEKCVVIPATFKNDSGIIGASSLIFD